MISNDHWTFQILISIRLRMFKAVRSIYIYAWIRSNLIICLTSLKLPDHSWFWWMFWRGPSFFTQHFISGFKFIIRLSKSISSTANANIFQQTQVANLFLCSSVYHLNTWVYRFCQNWWRWIIRDFLLNKSAGSRPP